MIIQLNLIKSRPMRKLFATKNEKKKNSPFSTKLCVIFHSLSFINITHVYINMKKI